MAPVDPDRLRPKVQHIRERLGRLRKIHGRGLEAFLGDPVLQDAAVRNLQTSVEALLDMANHIVAREGMGTPERYREAVDLLVEHGMLPADEAEAYRAMVGFRNRAVHLILRDRRRGGLRDPDRRSRRLRDLHLGRRDALFRVLIPAGRG